MGRYRDIFCPQSENTIYVIANHNNVIYPIYSLVYFWPNKGVFFADRVSLDKPVRGKLKIIKYLQSNSSRNEMHGYDIPVFFRITNVGP